MPEAVKYNFCTYFDQNYLLRGMTLFRSLEAHCQAPFNFHVLCLDDETFDALTRLAIQNMIPIALADVEQWDEALLTAKQNRSKIEYYFTLSPVLPLYVLEHFDCDLVTYLDADLMFFSSPEAIFEELGDKSIFTTEHRFPNQLKDREVYGRFNVQCQSFRKDETGLTCLRRWRKQCLGWCYDRLEDGKFADQKYLDEWPELYGEHLVISQHPGIGVAPWNISCRDLVISDSDARIDGSELIFYHFHGMQIIFPWLISSGIGHYFKPKKKMSVLKIYMSYTKKIADTQNKIGSIAFGSHIKNNSSMRLNTNKLQQIYVGLRLNQLMFIR